MNVIGLVLWMNVIVLVHWMNVIGLVHWMNVIGCFRWMMGSYWRLSSHLTLQEIDWTAAGGKSFSVLFILPGLHCIDDFISSDITSCSTRFFFIFRYVEPQWQLLVANNSANVSQLETEGCLDGWTFDRSEFHATTVSEVIRNCSLHFIHQSWG